MELRKADGAELFAVRALYRAVIGTPGCTWNEEYPGEFELTHDAEAGNLYVLAEGERLLGAVSVVSPNELDDRPCWTCVDGTQAEIARVVVARAETGKGLARHMLTMLFERLSEGGCHAVHLAVADCNWAARKTYERLGFAFLAECDMYGHHFFLCEKLL